MKPCCECMASVPMSVCNLYCALFDCWTTEAPCPDHVYHRTVAEYRAWVMA